TALGVDQQDVLRKGLGKARQRPGQHPDMGLVPARQIAGDDVAHHPPRDHRIAFGEHGAAGVQLRLRRQTVGGNGVGAHGRRSISLSSAIRSTCPQAMANSVAESLAMRRAKASVIEALVLSRTAMMKGKPCRSTYSVFWRWK